MATIKSVTLTLRIELKTDASLKAVKQAMGRVFDRVEDGVSLNSMLINQLESAGFKADDDGGGTDVTFGK